MNKRQRKKYLKKCGGRTFKTTMASISAAQKNRPHLMTMEEYAQYAAWCHGIGKKPDFVVLPPDGYPWTGVSPDKWALKFTESDPEQRASALQLEGPKLSPSFPGSKREPLGARSCAFPE